MGSSGFIPLYLGVYLVSLEDKMSRLRKLSQIQYPSDQDIEDMEILQEEIRLFYKDSELNQVVEPKPIIKKQKRSLLEIILNKIKTKPATWDEIQQLKLDKTRAELKRDIAKAKYEAKNPGGVSRKGNVKNKKVESVFGSQRGSVDGGLSKMIGKNDKTKYKDLIG